MRGYHAANQRVCLRYVDSKPGRKPRRQVFLRRRTGDHIPNHDKKRGGGEYTCINIRRVTFSNFKLYAFCDSSRYILIP